MKSGRRMKSSVAFLLIGLTLIPLLSRARIPESTRPLSIYGEPILANQANADAFCEFQGKRFRAKTFSIERLTQASYGGEVVRIAKELSPYGYGTFTFDCDLVTERCRDNETREYSDFIPVTLREVRCTDERI